MSRLHTGGKGSKSLWSWAMTCEGDMIRLPKVWVWPRGSLGSAFIAAYVLMKRRRHG